MLIEIRMAEGGARSIRAEDVRAIYDDNRTGCWLEFDARGAHRPNDPLHAAGTSEDMTARINEALAGATDEKGRWLVPYIDRDGMLRWSLSPPAATPQPLHAASSAYGYATGATGPSSVGAGSSAPVTDGGAAWRAPGPAVVEEIAVALDMAARKFRSAMTSLPWVAVAVRHPTRTEKADVLLLWPIPSLDRGPWLWRASCADEEIPASAAYFLPVCRPSSAR